MGEPNTGDTPTDPDAWTWWESRRLGYNLALATAGWAAYGLSVLLLFAFGRPLWRDWQSAVGSTISLGTGFLVLMFFANICFLLGVLAEGWTKPTNKVAYRKRAFALGLWGSIALPFLFPLGTLAQLVSSGGLPLN